MAPTTLPRDDAGFRLRGLEMTRIETFTDAAFAFALTLLVLAVEPPTSVAGLFVIIQDVPAFVASATLLMTFWWAHHEWSRRFGLDDGRTIVLSCLLVFTVLVYVYPLRFMAGLYFAWVGRLTGLPLASSRLEVGSYGEVDAMIALYSIGFTAMSASILLLNLHAWQERERLGLDALERHETRSAIGVWSIMAGVGATTTVASFLLPWTGAAPWIYMLLPFVMPWYSARMKRRRPDPGSPPPDSRLDEAAPA